MVPFFHLANFRDFSTCRKKDGTLLAPNIFARSNNPAFLDEEEIADLKARRLTTVVDLRRDPECETRPDCLANRPDFQYHHIVMNEDPYATFGDIIDPADVAAAYYSKLSVSARKIAAVFQLFAAAKDGVLFHCESGKDRTGTVAILLLLLNDIIDEDIAEDYRLSYDKMYGAADQTLLSDPTLVPKKETVSYFLQQFRQDFACCDDYFLQIGLTAKELSRIRGKCSGQ